MCCVGTLQQGVDRTRIDPYRGYHPRWFGSARRVRRRWCDEWIIHSVWMILIDGLVNVSVDVSVWEFTVFSFDGWMGRRVSGSSLISLSQNENTRMLQMNVLHVLYTWHIWYIHCLAVRWMIQGGWFRVSGYYRNRLWNAISCRMGHVFDVDVLVYVCFCFYVFYAFYVFDVFDVFDVFVVVAMQK